MKRNKINGNQIISNQVNDNIVKNKKIHRSNAEIAERQTRKELIEYLYNKEQNNTTGIITNFKPEFANKGYMLALLGATIEMIAIYFNTNISTLNKWGREIPEFENALKRGRMDYDMQVAEKLGQRALGYDYVEHEEWDVLNKKTGEITRMHKYYHKHMAPDVTAQQFWLQNRQRGLWTNTSKLDIHTQTDINIRKQIDLSVLSNVEAESVKQIAIAMLSKYKGSLENDKK